MPHDCDIIHVEGELSCQLTDLKIGKVLGLSVWLYVITRTLKIGRRNFKRRDVIQGLCHTAGFREGNAALTLECCSL